MPSDGVGGLAAAEGFVIVGGRTIDDSGDCWTFLDQETGLPLGSIEYPAPGELDYGNSPRATPLIAGSRAFLFGSLGHLTCVDLASLEPVWQRNLAEECGTPRLDWGLCGSPLLTEGMLIVQPGGTQAGLVAVDPETGMTRWQSAGGPPGHASCVLLEWSGGTQIIGCDQRSFGGWDAKNGRRLWTLAPEVPGEFFVPSPLIVSGRLLVTGENNGTRLYAFNEAGEPVASPIAVNAELAPESHTPVSVNGRIYGVWNGLHCLDPNDGLRRCWINEDPAFDRYASLLGSGNRLLALTERCELILLEDQGESSRELGRLPLTETRTETLSHPAWSDGSLYVRLGNRIVRLAL